MLGTIKSFTGTSREQIYNVCYENPDFENHCENCEDPVEVEQKFFDFIDTIDSFRDLMDSASAKEKADFLESQCTAIAKVFAEYEELELCY